MLGSGIPGWGEVEAGPASHTGQEQIGGVQIRSVLAHHWERVVSLALLINWKSNHPKSASKIRIRKQPTRDWCRPSRPQLLLSRQHNWASRDHCNWILAHHRHVHHRPKDSVTQVDGHSLQSRVWINSSNSAHYIEQLDILHWRPGLPHQSILQ